MMSGGDVMMNCCSVVIASRCVMMSCRSNVMASRCVMMLCCCNIDVFAAILALFFFKMTASHSTMFDSLVKVGLGEHYGVFF